MAILFEQNTELQQEVKILTRALEMQDSDLIQELGSCKSMIGVLNEEKNGMIGRI